MEKQWHLEPYGVLQIRGQDAEKLLQGQLTCDIANLHPGNSSLCALCNPKGRVINLFYIFSLSKDLFYIITLKEMLPITLAALNKYAKFYKVSLSEVSENFLVVGTETLTDSSLPSIPVPTTQHYLLLVPLEAAKKTSLLPYNDWHFMMLKAKIPLIYPKTSEKFLPHELNLPRLSAVSFTKGCFTGQEIIARMEYKSKIKIHLHYKEIMNINSLEIGGDFYMDSSSQVIGTLVDVGYHSFVHEQSASLENPAKTLVLISSKQPTLTEHCFFGVNKKPIDLYSIDS